MKVNNLSTREDVYNAPTIPWNNDTYTPISNKFIMDMVEDKLNNMGLVVKNQSFRTALSKEGLVKGVIGAYDVTTDNGEFGQRVMFRNSYDKSMSFAFVCGMVVWVCENGCISGDYTYRRIHRGVITDDISTTMADIIFYIGEGFKSLQASFEKTSVQLNELKHFEVSPTDAYQIVGELFFNQEVISVNQLSIIKKEFEYSNNFKHLGAADFTAYDLYNHITESLKRSHPLNYINDHVTTHKLFEQTFNI